MIINFVGLFGQSGSGEVSDETHIARSMEELGHTVRRIPRDEWREYCNEGYPKGKYPNIPDEFHADFSLFAKWHHFNNGVYIRHMKILNPKKPVFYWVWDSVDLGVAWHRDMAVEADLYLSGELGRASEFNDLNIRFYYFQFDVVDGDMAQFNSMKKKYDVVYLGSCDNQNGRIDLLKEINKSVPIQCFGHDYQEWQKQGFIANSAVYGNDANKIIGESKIVLGTSCDPHLYGYWSNRVGRVLYGGGKLLQQYTPGMENFLHDWVEYYSSPQEAIDKIQDLLSGQYKSRGIYDKQMWTSRQKVKDLLIMAERYLEEDNGKDWLLPERPGEKKLLFEIHI